ncbi:TPA: hypothetical protein N0F65_003173 [Lagenidium giganteum]|uniref:1-phosphatidylinositol 4-kinase n=1 Tax=Lagenidium giganteum TaxID=4803 RepID=A0AAV2ZAQ1_9STRA|nr:TPA: hypothetical protein N0F65_003173 [Lagenidium giganteum]
MSMHEAKEEVDDVVPMLPPPSSAARHVLSAAADDLALASPPPPSTVAMMEATGRKHLGSDPISDDMDTHEELEHDDADGVVAFEGYLRKRYSSSMYMGSWRYCVLRGNRLRWFLTAEKAEKGLQVRGEVVIKAVEHWSGQGSVNLYAHAFAIRTTSNRVLLCSAKSARSKDEWVQVLRMSVGGKPSSDNGEPRTTEGGDGRRIVPEDVMRSTCVETPVHDKDLQSQSGPEIATAIVSSVVPTSESAPVSNNGECSHCAVRFKSLISRRAVCASCERTFCSRHCRRHVKLHHLGLRATRRCCYRCARRQEFICYLEALTGFTGSVLKRSQGLDALCHQSAAEVEGTELYERTLHKLRVGQMSLIKTIKILYQTRKKPHLFRAALERLPHYVENCIDRLESLWYQVLHIFQCCDSDLDSSAVQMFLLKRYIRAICRRSPRIALQTIWHVQASVGDSSSLHPNSLLSLLGFLYPSSDESTKIWKDLLLSDCPDHQSKQILEKIKRAHQDGEKIIRSQKDDMLERWLNAATVDEFEACAREIGCSGVHLCDYQSSISYDSLKVEGNPQSSAHVESLVAEQVNFVQTLAAISERLRHVQPRSRRNDVLKVELKELNDHLHSSALYPLCTASDELYKVVRIPPTEGKVFSTKMRAPTLIFIETVPVDATNLVGSQERLRPFLSNRGNSTLLESMVEANPTSEDRRDSMISSDSSNALTTHSPRRLRKVSNLSCPEDLDSMSSLDEDSPNMQSSTTISQFLTRHLTFPTSNATASAHALNSPASSCFSRPTGHGQRLGVDSMVYESKVYGESWEERQERIRSESPMGHLDGWKLFSIIVKTNDDLRQEMFTMQLINKFQAIFEFEGIDLWLRTYRIVATGANIGLLETINDACSLDHLKKTFTDGNLAAYFRSVYGEPSSPVYEQARMNFIKSMAAYSIVSYVLLVKDRHNGNILLSTEGHIIHIDFGFILGIAPGGMFSIEDAPFKLTCEMVEIMGGIDSPGYALYSNLLCKGLLSLQKYQSEIAALLQTTGQHSPFPCFEGAKLARIVADLRDRLCVGLTKIQVEKRVGHLLRKSYNSWGTRQYDAFQLRSNNIAP